MAKETRRHYRSREEGGMRIIAGLIFFAPVFALIIGMIGGIVCVIAIVSVVPS